MNKLRREILAVAVVRGVETNRNLPPVTLDVYKKEESVRRTPNRVIITERGCVMVDELDSAVFPTKLLTNLAWIKEVNVNRPPCLVAGHTRQDCVEDQRPGSAVFLSQVVAGTGSCSAAAAAVACKIKNSSKITLLKINPSQVKDGADPYSNIRDACAGKVAKRSSYKCDEGQAPGGSTCLDSKILQYIYDLGTSTKYPFQVNAIAGACHKIGSKHYNGKAVDIQLEKNSREKAAQEKAFRDECTKHGGWSHGGDHKADLINYGYCCSGEQCDLWIAFADKRCMDKGGKCQQTSVSCSGAYTSGLCGGSASRKCCVPHTDANFQTVGRVVFGEARGETARGQLAVAYSIVNRINHSGYPNTLNAVVNQKTAGGAYQYETLGVAAHTKAWNVAKKGNTQEYKNAIKASSDALCGRVSDPTTCATDYCAYDPCSATNSNKYWTATNKIQIGRHYFVCRVKASG
uniref:Spore cortex-lytic enzyme n=1 Tax=Magallana gigas TaxID=29159 RepID=K1PCK0_MAGGI